MLDIQTIIKLLANVDFAERTKSPPTEFQTTWTLSQIRAIPQLSAFSKVHVRARMRSALGQAVELDNNYTATVTLEYLKQRGNPCLYSVQYMARGVKPRTKPQSASARVKPSAASHVVKGPKHTPEALHQRIMAAVPYIANLQAAQTDTAVAAAPAVTAAPTVDVRDVALRLLRAACDLLALEQRT